MRRPKDEGGRLKDDGGAKQWRFILLPSAFSLLIASCTQPRPTAAPLPPPPAPVPAPVAVVEPPKVPTLDEVRSLRTNNQLDLYEAGLKTLAQSPDAQTKGRALALLALLYVDQKRTAEALPVLREAADADPLVAPWLRLRALDIEGADKKWPDALITAIRIIHDTPASSAATIARLRLPALYAAAGDASNTDAAFQSANAIPIDALTEEDFVWLAKSLAKAGRMDLANPLRMRLLTEFTQGRFTEDTYDHVSQYMPSPLDALSFDDQLAIAQKLGRNDRYGRAFDLLGRIAARFPKESAASSAFRAVRLRALFNSRRYSDLLAETDRVKLTDPALILTRARAAWRADQPTLFLAGLKQIEKQYPSSPEATEAKILRAKYYVTDEVKYGLATADLEAAISAGAVGNEGENLWTLGWTYFRAGRLDDALNTFARYAKQFPDGDYLSNSLFWAAKIHERRGNTMGRDAALHELESNYPYSYFSYRARAIMGEPILAPNEVANGNIFPDVDGQLAASNEPRLDAVRELAWLGLYREATREMKSIAAANPTNLGLQFMLADLYVQGGEPFSANNVLQRKFRQFVRHGGTGIPHRFWEILFPLNYWETIKTESEQRQIDPYLIASIIRQETGFEPTTVSNADAVGIMQIMPAEAAAIAARAGLPAPTREQLFDPKLNIAVGVAEFQQKLASEHGNTTLAIAAYNAGEEPVGRWIAQTPVDDEDLFVESIPFAETRLYVKTVSRNRFEYRRIYEAPAKP
ncbi:MAG: soluble lytic murein transglycosylase [Thermoanaerobaculia bacterium]|nr:soluble lytic murein transglycosylase [Thermoanaerobaculia bacterium]